jgi:hypothetical protein
MSGYEYYVGGGGVRMREVREIWQVKLTESVEPNIFLYLSMFVSLPVLLYCPFVKLIQYTNPTCKILFKRFKPAIGHLCTLYYFLQNFLI